MTAQPPTTQFTKDWFSAGIPNWKSLAAPHLTDRPCLGLEIGSYEGRSAVWTLENMLNHPESRLICVDIWTNKEVEKTFDRNIVATESSHRVTKIKGEAQKVLKSLWQPLDFCYVDADHIARSVIAQIAIVWPVLKKGAIIIFDDYLWQHPTESAHEQPPKPGIDAFLALWQSQFELLHQGYQVIVRKL